MRFKLLCGACAVALAVAGCAQSDAGITTKVKSELIADDLVKARQINVDTKDHVVTLTGEVRTPEEESRAMEIARKTEGVTSVVDLITVVPEQAALGTVESSLSDAGITAAVKTKLLADPDTPGLKLDVDTKDQVVTLSGTVANKTQKEEALQIAKNVEGVRGVNDRVTIQRN
jgi:hyperosmotically inducible protein